MLMFSLERQLSWPRPVDVLPWSLRTWASLARRNAGMGNMLQKQANRNKIWGQVLGAVQLDWDSWQSTCRHSGCLAPQEGVALCQFQSIIIHRVLNGPRCNRQHLRSVQETALRPLLEALLDKVGIISASKSTNEISIMEHHSTNNIPNGRMDHWLQLSAMHDLPCLVKALELEDESLKSFKGQLDSDVVPWAAIPWNWKWIEMVKMKMGFGG